eukprot:4573954-Prymnesium_polylepis.1
MIRRLMRTPVRESRRERARRRTYVRGPALSARRRGETAKRLRRGDHVSPEQLHVFENGRINYSAVITGADYCRAIILLA